MSNELKSRLQLIEKNNLKNEQVIACTYAHAQTAASGHDQLLNANFMDF